MRHDHCSFTSNQLAGYALLPRGQSLCAASFSVRRGFPLRPELRASTPMGGRQVGATVATVCYRHLCLRGDEQSLSSAASWSEREVAERWAELFQWPHLGRRWYQGDMLIEPELAAVQQLLTQ